MALQDESIGDDSHQQQNGVDFQLQLDGPFSQKNFVDWLNQQNQIVADTCDTSLQSCKRDWMNERGESSQCSSRFQNGTTRVVSKNANRGPRCDGDVPVIELDSDEDPSEEPIDLTYMYDELDDFDMSNNLQGTFTLGSNLLDSYNTVNTPVECIDLDEDVSDHSYEDLNNDVIDIDDADDIIDTDSDVLSVHVDDDVMINDKPNPNNEGCPGSLGNTEVSCNPCLDATMDYTSGLDNVTGNDFELANLLIKENPYTSILSEINVVDTMKNNYLIELYNNNAVNLNGLPFTPILSFCYVSNYIVNIEIKSDDDNDNKNSDNDNKNSDNDNKNSDNDNKKPDTDGCNNHQEERITMVNRKKKGKGKRKKKKKKKQPLPPHIVQRIIQEKKEQKFLQKLQRASDEKNKKLKKEDIKEECKVGDICEEISPATTDTTALARTIACQTLDISRIFIKEEEELIKEEDDV